jgi:hypothetical protein
LIRGDDAQTVRAGRQPKPGPTIQVG